MSDLERAKAVLASKNSTCALCRGESTYTSFERGVKPLAAWLGSGLDLHGFSAADKVVGKGAAFLYLLLGVSAVYARVISVPAAELLQSHGVLVEYEAKTSHIINRKGDGICPFEEAVMEIEDAEIAYRAIRQKMVDMNIKL